MLDAPGNAAIWFSWNLRVEKGDLVVILGFHGETDGELLTVEMFFSKLQHYSDSG